MSWTGSRKEFIEKFGPYIKKVTKGTGIYPGTLISQAIVESSGKVNGSFKVGGSKLSREANNFFGIKAGSSWRGSVYKIRTREVINGQEKYIEANFRKYPTVEQSILDYVLFLKGNPRYTKYGVFQAKNVPDQFKALKAAGYATGTSYVDLLNSVYKSIQADVATIPDKTTRSNIPAIAAAGLLLYLISQ